MWIPKGAVLIKGNTVLNETKALEEIVTKLETAILKKGFGIKLMSKKHGKD